MEHVSLNPPGANRGGADPGALLLLSKPLCAAVLRAHGEGPLALDDLERRLGLRGERSALRGRVVKLREAGALKRRVLPRMPYTVLNELTGPGRVMLRLADELEEWFAAAPGRAVELGGDACREAVEAFVAGWRSGVLHALSVRPMSLTELDRAIPAVSYPSLGRRVAALRSARLIEAAEGDGPGTPLAMTEWCRRAFEGMTEGRPPAGSRRPCN